MQQDNRLPIAFIGFGEVGQTFARGLLARGEAAIRAYDVLFDRPEGSKLCAAADALGVTRVLASGHAVEGASIIISAVTAAAAESVAVEAARHLRPGQIFFDINSAAPSTKQRAAAHVQQAGAHYVEGAVMAPVLRPGLAVPILAGGPHAVEAARILNGLGMNLSAVATEHGKASAMKLCRSIIIKGLEALMVDCAAASELHGVKEPVFASLAETFPSIDWHALSENMRERVATHGVRRSAEMLEAGEMLAALGMDRGLADAVAAAQLRGARGRDIA